MKGPNRDQVTDGFRKVFECLNAGQGTDAVEQIERLIELMRKLK